MVALAIFDNRDRGFLELPFTGSNYESQFDSTINCLNGVLTESSQCGISEETALIGKFPATCHNNREVNRVR